MYVNNRYNAGFTFVTRDGFNKKQLKK